jgi:hypothetical protein
MQQALTSLSAALQSGDTTTAKSVLADIMKHVPTGSDSASSSTSSATTGSSGTSATDNFSDLLQSLQSAVTSGDTSTASSLVSSLKEYLTENSPTASGVATYSSGGTVSSNSSSTLSILA